MAAFLILINTPDYVFMKQFFLATVLILFTSIVSGCLDMDFEEPNTSFTLSIGLQSPDTPLIQEEDTLEIIGARFLLNNIEMEAVSDNEIFEENKTLVNISNFGVQNEMRVASGELLGGEYVGISYELEVPGFDTEIVDDELVVRDDTGNVTDVFSMVIIGLKNSEPFVFKSKYDERVEYSFDRNVNLPEKDGLLDIILMGEWKEWFTSNDGEILDPTDSANQSAIEENFSRFFTAEISTVGEE